MDREPTMIEEQSFYGRHPRGATVAIFAAAFLAMLLAVCCQMWETDGVEIKDVPASTDGPRTLPAAPTEEPLAYDITPKTPSAGEVVRIDK